VRNKLYSNESIVQMILNDN